LLQHKSTEEEEEEERPDSQCFGPDSKKTCHALTNMIVPLCIEGVLDQDAILRRWQIVWQYLRKKSQN
jgi:hypothetical protein